MSQPSNEKLSWPLIAAGGFLLISLIASGVILVNVLNAPLPQAQVTAQSVSTQTGVQQGTEPAADQSLVQPEQQIVIAIAPLTDKSPDLTEKLTTVLQKTLADSPLRGVTVTAQSIPDGISTADLVDPHTIAGADLLVVWGEEDKAVPVYISGSTTPGLTTLDVHPDPWLVPAPGVQPLYEAPSSDMKFTALMVVSLLEISRGQHDAASAHLQQMQTLPIEIPFDLQQDNQTVTLFALANDQASRGDYAGALALYSQSLRVSDQFIAALFNRGGAYLQTGDAQAALAAFAAKDVANAYPLPVAYNQTLAYLAAGDGDQALLSANQMVDLSGSAGWALNLRGIVNTSRQDDEAALADFAQAAKSAQSVIALFNQARLLRLTGKLDEALALYDQLLSREPGNSTYYLEQALTYRDAGKTQQARFALNRAIELGHDYEEAYIQRGLLELSEKEYDRAEADGLAAQKINPQDGRADAIIGESLLNQEEFDKAEDAYTAALDKGETSPEVFAGRGWSRHRQRFIRTAIDDYKQALSLGLNDNTLLLRLGFALIDADQEDEALNVLMGAVNGGLDSAEAHAGLALALDMNLRRSDAEIEYKKALDLDKNYGDLEFLAEQPLWSQRAITRARTIIQRLEK